MDQVRNEGDKLIIKKNEDIRETLLEEEGVNNVLRRVLIGSEDGSDNIIMRCFKILPRGNTPFHRHDFEHVVKVEKGKGLIINETGKETTIQEGQSLYISSGEMHQFKNPFEKTFEFICIIPNPEKK